VTTGDKFQKKLDDFTGHHSSDDNFALLTRSVAGHVVEVALGFNMQ
jgi:hypothetical protein